MRTRDLYLIVGTALCLVVAVCGVAFFELKGTLDVMLERPDPECVARGEADNERLARAIAPYLPSVGLDDIEFGHGCGPPESGGPWIAAELPRASIDEALLAFRAPLWTPLPAGEAQKMADPGEVAVAVTGEVDHRKAEVYAFRAGRGKGPVRITAWFDLT